MKEVLGAIYKSLHETFSAKETCPSKCYARLMPTAQELLRGVYDILIIIHMAKSRNHKALKRGQTLFFQRSNAGGTKEIGGVKIIGVKEKL